jgi:hypothetical protein
LDALDILRNLNLSMLNNVNSLGSNVALEAIQSLIDQLAVE